MELNDVLLTLKAIELMTVEGGERIITDKDSIKNGYINKAGKIIGRCTENVPNFVTAIDDKVKEFAGLYTSGLVREGKTYKSAPDDEPNIRVDWDMFLSTMRHLYKLGVTKYQGVDELLLDPELEQRLSKIDAEFDRYPTPPLTFDNIGIDKVKQNFNILTAINYSHLPELLKKLVSAYSTSLTEFPTFEGVKVYDNRIYIAVNESDRYTLKKHGVYDVDDIKYIVVSKNLYDYYFCSYGSSFQSCFSLNSSHRGYFGMIPFGLSPSHFIIYATTEEPQKYTIMSSNKWYIPKMFFRAWGWLCEDNKIHVDRIYDGRGNNSDGWLEVLTKLGFSFEDGYIKDWGDMLRVYFEYGCKTYLDSTSTNCNMFRRMGGQRSFVGRENPKFSLEPYNYSCCKDILSDISDCSETFDPLLPWVIEDSVLFNYKICPITGLRMETTETVGKYAKFFTKPVDKPLMVLTYIDGRFCLTDGEPPRTDHICRDAASGLGSDYIQLGKRFSSIPKPLTVFKERLKQLAKLDNVMFLLRLVEDDKVTFIKYR